MQTKTVVAARTTSAAGVAADRLEMAGCCCQRPWSGRSVRKLFNTVGMGGCALFFLLLSFQVPPSASPTGPSASPGNQSLLTMMPEGAPVSEGGASTSALLLALAIGIGGVAAGGGYWPALGDLGVEYSQVLVGTSNSIASIPGILGSSLVGNLLATSNNDWALVFRVAAAIEAFGALIFLGFVSAEDQKFGDLGMPLAEPSGGGNSVASVEESRAAIDSRGLLQHVA